MSKSETVPQEIIDWREALCNPKLIERSMQEIVKAMSNGFDVSPLFQDVLKHMQTNNLKLKKLIYIYLTSNSYQNSNYTLLIVNGIENDSRNESPFVRALAIRAMGAVVTNDVAEHFCQSFARFATDSDPFVRKTTCAAIAKLYHVNSNLAQDTGLINTLRQFIFDSNTSVIAAATAALINIYSASHPTIFSNAETQQLLLALTSANEWSAQTILSAISQFAEINEPQIAIQQIQPFLQHANPAVCLNAVNLMNKFGVNSELSLVSLISQAGCSEVQFVAMRALRLAIVKKESFSRNLKLFYVNFKDEIYVKIEKIELLAQLVSIENVQDVINELTEYCQDVNDQIVRKSLAALAKIAVNVPQSADMVVQTFILLLTGKNQIKEIGFRLQSYAAQELLVQIQHIFRAFPDRYESVIQDLCEAIVSYDDFRAKSALIWILGEYSDRIEGVEEVVMELIDDIENVSNEHFEVQFSLLNAASKIYLSNQNETTQKLFLDLVDLMVNSDEPGVKIRARYLQKLFKMDSTLQLAKSVIYVQKSIPIFTDGISPVLQQKLMMRLGSVEATLRQTVIINEKVDKNEAEDVAEQFTNAEYESKTPIALSNQPSQPQFQQIQPQVQQMQPQQPQMQFQQPMQPQIPQQVQQPQQPQMQQQQPPAADLLDNVLGSNQPKHQAPQQDVNLMDDIFGFGAPPAPPAVPVVPSFQAPQQQQQPIQQQQPVQQQQQPEPQQQITAQTPQSAYNYQSIPVRPKEQSYPLKLQISFTKKNDQPILLVQIKNTAQTPIMKPVFVFAPNPFGLQAQDPNISVIPALNMFNNGNFVEIPFISSPPATNFNAKMNQNDIKMMSQFNVLTFQVNTSQGTSYFYQLKLPISLIFTASGFWHKQRMLTDLTGAKNAIQQAISWPEFHDNMNVFYNQMGVTDYAQCVQKAIFRLQEANFLLIQTHAENAEFAAYFTAGGLQIASIVKLNWFIGRDGSSVDFKIEARVQQNYGIVGQYVSNVGSTVIQGK